LRNRDGSWFFSHSYLRNWNARHFTLGKNTLPDHKHSEQDDSGPWNPKQYLRFSDHRLRPAIELLERVPLESPKLIFDLGCGTGNVTRIVAERWHCARVYGLDNSTEMLQKAQDQPGEIQWLEVDIKNWIPDEAPDLIFSNAALHWVERHQDLFPRLASSLNRGGCLAVQMPLSWDATSHRLMRETLADGGAAGRPLGSEALRAAVARRWVEDAEFYYDILANDARNVDIWETEYLHVLAGEDPVLEWVKGTGLRPILNGLEDDERDVFLAQYRCRLRDAYPVKSNGCTLYPFRRLFIVALV
jgi:trans-aconitate 2-methyltransferase